MFKGTVENKQQHSGTFEDAFGRRHTRIDLEDPARPGHLKLALVPIDPGVWNAGAHFGLLTPTGRPLKYVEQQPDPREPRAEEAPAKLREEVATAQGELDGFNAERQRIVDELCRAEDGVRETAELAYTRRIGEDDARQKIAEFEATRTTLEEDLRQLDSRLPSVQRRLSEAQRRLRWWVDDVRLQRQAKA